MKKLKSTTLEINANFTNIFYWIALSFWHDSPISHIQLI